MIICALVLKKFKVKTFIKKISNLTDCGGCLTWLIYCGNNEKNTFGMIQYFARLVHCKWFQFQGLWEMIRGWLEMYN